MIDILNRWTRAVLFHSETAQTIGEAVIEADLSGSDLSRSDLSGSDLSGSDLSGSDLSGSDLSVSDLSRSDLSRSDLSGSDLSISDLRRSDLSGSDLSGSDLSGSDLSGSNLSRSNLRGAKRGGYVIANHMQLLSVAEWGPVLVFMTTTGELLIECGCQRFSISEAHTYWDGKPDRKMTCVALQMAELWAAAIKEKKSEAAA